MRTFSLRRRQLMLALAMLLPVAARRAGASSPAGRVLRVGILGTTTAAGFASQWNAFRQGLHELGWAEGRDIVVEMRFADNQHERLPALAAELIASRIDLLATHGIPGTRAAKGATRTTPILMASVADPLAAGLVTSFVRPGGNVTGIAFLAQELAAKRLQLLKERLPGLSRAAVQPAQRGLQRRHVRGHVGGSPGLAAATAVLRRTRSGRQCGGLRPDDGQAHGGGGHHRRGHVHRQRCDAGGSGPAAKTVGNPEFAQAGGLLGYGANREAIFRRAAVLADKLLRGAKPAEMPIEQPTQLELVLNQRTAAALGLALPAPIRLRADRVIE